ncbi:MAG: hypothetical protein ABIX01_10365 [Chitinophagaceae bacterium]
MPAKIILSRKNDFMNRTRMFKVLIDGQEVGKIGNGKVETFEVAPGNHTIECKIDWCSSQTYEVTVGSDSIDYLQVKSGMKYFLLLYIVFLAWLASGLIFKQKKEMLGAAYPWIQWTIVVIPLAYLLYYLTLGKKKYLVINQDTSNVFAG